MTSSPLPAFGFLRAQRGSLSGQRAAGTLGRVVVGVNNFGFLRDIRWATRPRTTYPSWQAAQRIPSIASESRLRENVTTWFSSVLSVKLDLPDYLQDIIPVKPDLEVTTLNPIDPIHLAEDTDIPSGTILT
jgi:anti-sigma factor RsiW